MKSCVNDVKVGVLQTIQVDAMNCSAEIDTTFGAVVHRCDNHTFIDGRHGAGD